MDKYPRATKGVVRKICWFQDLKPPQLTLLQTQTLAVLSFGHSQGVGDVWVLSTTAKAYSLKYIINCPKWQVQVMCHLYFL